MAIRRDCRQADARNRDLIKFAVSKGSLKKGMIVE
jgi:hypothetical protein